MPTFFNKNYQNERDQFYAAIRKNDAAKVSKILNQLPVEEKEKIINSFFPDTKASTLSYVCGAKGFDDNDKTLKLINVLLENGADPALRDNEIPDRDKFCNTALLYAIANNKWGIAKRLTAQYDPKKYEDYINAPSLANTSKNSPLILALKNPTVPTDIIQLLLEHGANPNAVNHLNETPLHFAATLGVSEILTLLLQYGAQIDVKNKNGILPFEMYYLNYIVPEADTSGITIIEEEEGIPLLYFGWDPQVDQNYKWARQIFPSVSVDAGQVNSSKISFKVNDQFSSLNFNAEMLANETNAKKRQPDPSKDIAKQLEPENYSVENLKTRIDKTIAKHLEQVKLIKDNKFILRCQHVAVQKLLDKITQHILAQSNLAQFIPPLRYDIANAPTLKKVQEVYEDDYAIYKNYFNRYGLSIPSLIEQIYQDQFNLLVKEMKNSSQHNWQLLANELEKNQPKENVEEALAYIVQTLLPVNNNAANESTHEVSQMLEKAGVDKAQQDEMLNLSVNFSIAPRKSI